MRSHDAAPGRARDLCGRTLGQLVLSGLTPFLKPEWRRFLRQQKPYEQWLEANQLTAAGIADLRARLAASGGDQPVISVVMPVYRPAIEHLRLAVGSVRAQIYQHWELCLCDDGSADPALTAELQQLGSSDPRVRVVQSAWNGGIAAATNNAAALATGDVLLFLDQDDLLAGDCLAEFALAFAGRPEAGLAYSDSDKVDGAGRRHAPSFKPGWSPWLLLSYMYPSHAVAMRRELFTRLGGLRSAFDGSQDFDLLLRASEVAHAVVHIPRVLYHWRATAGSTALGADQKPGSIAAGRAAVAAAVERRRLAAEATQPDWAQRACIGLFELKWTGPRPGVTLVILPERGRAPDSGWMTDIRASLPPKVEVVLASAAGTIAQGLADACAGASGEIVVCLQAGFTPRTSDWLETLSRLALASGGVVGARVTDQAGRVVAAGLVSPPGGPNYVGAFAGLAEHRPGALYLARVLHECAAVPAACMAMPRQLACDGLVHVGAADDAFGLGANLSEHSRRAGRSVLVAAHCDVAAPPGFVMPAPLAAGLPDVWYNPNLGRNHRQFAPRAVSPRVRQTAPVRLAVVTHNLDREGAQTTLVDLLQGLKSAGQVEPLVISSRPGALEEDLAELGIPLRIVARPGRRASAAATSVYRTALADLFRQTGVQAVLANTLDSYSAINAATLAGLRALWWQHEGGAWHRYFGRLPLRDKALAYAAFGQSYRVVQVADATRKAWLPLATRDNFEVVRYGIPPARLAADLSRWARPAARAELGLEADTCCVFLLGSVSARKAQADVIAALSALPAERVRKLRVMIAGAFVEPQYRAQLERMVAALPLSHRCAISLCGPVPDAALYFAAADLFVCCSRRESAPRAIVEAMFFGLPVVTTAVDGIPELVEHGETGLFYRAGRPRELGAAIVGLADDPGLRDRLGRTARERVAAISDYEGMIDRFGGLIREAAWQGGRVAAL